MSEPTTPDVAPVPAPSDRTRIRRIAEHGRYDRPTIDAILDAGLVAHVGLIDRTGSPVVVPMAYARIGDRVVVHGSAASRTVRAGAAGLPMCVTVTLLDGLVVARSLFESSMRYRSVVVMGDALAVDDPAEKLEALLQLSEHLMPGRTAEARHPSTKELQATRLFALTLDEASAKVNDGFPTDDPADLALDVWAGVVPMRTVLDQPVDAPDLREGITLDPSVRAWLP